jgi:hypothetical protein
MGKIIGESFKSWVRDQIKVRQEKLSNNNNRNDDILKYITNKGTFIRLSSGVNIEDSNYLAANFPIFGGDITFAAGTSNGSINIGAPKTGNATSIRAISGGPITAPGGTINSYWWSEKFGYAPPPGIVSAEVRPLEMGQIREANIQIVCHNLEQFEIIEQLYLRLKYSIFLEWGHTMYYDNKGNFIKNAPIQNNLFNQFISNANNHIEFLKTIEKKRQESNGNYDAFLGFVTNFEWSLRPDGGYDITLRAYSLGDVIESLKVNVNFPIIGENWNNNSDVTNDYIALNRDRSTLHYILYKLKKEIDIQSSGGRIYALDGFNNGGKSSIHTGEIKRITGLKVNNISPQEKWDVANNILTYQEFTSGYYPNLSNSINGKQYFIKLGSLLRIINNFLLLYNTNAKDSPLININYDYDSNLCFTLPRQSSTDPRVCVLDLPEFADTTVTSNPYDETYEVSYRYTVFINTSTASENFPNGGSVNGLFEYTSNFNQTLDQYATIRVTKGELDSLGYTVGANIYLLEDELFFKQLQQIPKDQILSLAKINSNESENIISGLNTNFAFEGYYSDDYPKAEFYITIDDVIVNDVTVAPSVFQNSQAQYAAYFCGPTPKFNNIDLKRFFRVKNNDYLGKPMHILVNIQCIIDILNSIEDLDENSDVSLYDFLNTLMIKIQSSLGNINNFKVIYDEPTNTFNIIDMTFLPGGLKQLNLENQTSRFHLNTLNKNQGSFITNFSLKTEITNDLATNIVVGAQGQGNQVGFNATAFSKWNLNLTDRILKEKANFNSPNYDDPKSKNNPFEKYRVNLSDYYYLVYRISTGEITDGEIDTYKGLLPDILNYEVGYHTNNDDIPGTGFIPLNLQLEMDGLSGMRIYETYNTEEKLLPKSYQNNLEFITTTLTHKIDNKGWITTINGIGSPKYTATPKYNPPQIVLFNGCPPQINSQNVPPSLVSPDDNPNSVFYYNSILNWAPLTPVLDLKFNPIRVSSAPQPNRGGSSHYGIDIAAPIGTLILAPENGVYLTEGFGFTGMGDYGVMVKGTSSNLYHIFGHNSARSKTFKNGDSVKAGDIIAYVGNEGKSSGPHLHWEIRKQLINGDASNYFSPITFSNINSTPPSSLTNLPVPGY